MTYFPAKNFKVLLLLALLIFFVLPGFSSTITTAHVVGYGTYGNGNVWVTLDAATDQPGCATPYLEFPSTAPTNKSILATAAIALTTGAPVLVQVDGCLGTGENGRGTFTGARNGTAFGILKQ